MFEIGDKVIRNTDGKSGVVACLMGEQSLILFPDGYTRYNARGYLVSDAGEVNYSVFIIRPNYNAYSSVGVVLIVAAVVIMGIVGLGNLIGDSAYFFSAPYGMLDTPEEVQ